MNKKLSKVNRVGQEIPRVSQIVMFMFNHSVSTYPSLAEPMLWQLLAYRYEKKAASHSLVHITHTSLQQSLPMTGVKKGCGLSTPSTMESIKDSCLPTVTFIVIYLSERAIYVCMSVVFVRKLQVSALPVTHAVTCCSFKKKKKRWLHFYSKM